MSVNDFGPVGVYALTAVFTLLLLYAGYLAFSHPLSGYPGPFLAKFTNFHAGIHVIRRELHLKILQNHEKYGSVFRLGPNRLVFNTTTALRDIYQNDQVVKSYTYRSAVRNNVDNVFTSVNKDVHRGKRKLVAPALAERSMRLFEPALIEQIDICLRQILEASQKGQTVNFTEKARYFALDAVAKLGFGYDLQVQTSSQNRFLIKAMAFTLYRLNIWHHLFFLSKLWFDRIMDKIFHKVREKLAQLVETMIRTRMAKGREGVRDFYSFISELSAEEGSLRKGELWWEANFLLVAGSDTTAAALSATMFYLSTNADCYQRLCKELRTTFKSSDQIKSGPLMASCHYLRACIDESMRMSPPVPGTAWRMQDPNDDQPLIIDGHVIPRGTLFGVNAYAIHHNEAYFEDSFAFKPERWLENDPTPWRPRKHCLEAFAAFSTGTRSCVGKPMACMELNILLAKLLWYFDFEKAPGKLGEVGGGDETLGSGRDRKGEFQLEDIFASRHDGPNLVFQTRGEFWKEL